jgi:hypothetical protein
LRSAGGFSPAGGSQGIRLPIADALVLRLAILRAGLFPNPNVVGPVSSARWLAPGHSSLNQRMPWELFLVKEPTRKDISNAVIAMDKVVRIELDRFVRED